MAKNIKSILELAAGAHHVAEVEREAELKEEAREIEAKKQHCMDKFRAVVAPRIPEIVKLADLKLSVNEDPDDGFLVPEARLTIDEHREIVITEYRGELQVIGRYDDRAIHSSEVGTNDDMQQIVLLRIYDITKYTPSDKPTAEQPKPKNRPDNGGPAFPRPASEDRRDGTLADGDSVIVEQDGMTLRDYFAAKAMQGFCVLPFDIKLDVKKCVADAYAVADAMLKARQS